MQKATNQQWRSRTPPDGILKTIAAYKRKENIKQACKRFDVKERTFYDWVKKLDIPRHHPRKNYDKPPSPQVQAAIAAYQSGEKVDAIIANFKPSWSLLYRWIDKLEIPRRKPPRERKVGRPLLQPLVRECAWCHKDLSAYQVRRRRKYCCRGCQDKAINHSRIRIHCPAPGCGAEIYDDSPFCSWTCFKTAMDARFEKRVAA